ncbi:hypothetical protein [Noviherbaspirillum sp. UKPF54]|uniref:hypothetical protein n=1 Tax=Noviherbaspirillum sp. UKPF54 TaxID=2601898 RepID=UPI0011B16A1B|nr:hypothetical protein [Noviherbaspirillum sp. UKPF54]QDZ29893.1 hypothetical protein FAY22_19150 [Noviherbaspirillum sp. UKPF54]
MGIIEKKTPQHWNFFLALEDDLVRLARYLEPTTDNFDAYSLELARILSTASSEVDVVAKQLCQKLNPDSAADRITAYMNEITAVFPEIAQAEASIPKFGLMLNPWEQWGLQKSPLWWKAYNNVKHKRHTHFQEANLKHALNAVAALFILLLFFYTEEGERGLLSPDPILFRAGQPFTVDHAFWERNVTIYSRNGMIVVANPVT